MQYNHAETIMRLAEDTTVINPQELVVRVVSMQPFDEAERSYSVEVSFDTEAEKTNDALTALMGIPAAVDFDCRIELQIREEWPVLLYS